MGYCCDRAVQQRLDARKALRAQASAADGLSGLLEPNDASVAHRRETALQMHAWHEV